MTIRSCDRDYAPVLTVNVSRPYFSTRLQGAREKFGVWGRASEQRGLRSPVSGYVTARAKNLVLADETSEQICLRSPFLKRFPVTSLVVTPTEPEVIELRTILFSREKFNTRCMND